MSAGTYLHTSRYLDRETRRWTPTNVAYDGLVDGSDTKLFACEYRELGERARIALITENKGDRLDRFLVVKGRWAA